MREGRPGTELVRPGPSYPDPWLTAALFRPASHQQPIPQLSQSTPAPKSATPGPVRLTIYNILGQPVRTLVNQFQPAGFYQVRWDARDQRGTALAAGVYLVRLHYPGGEQTRRLLLLK